jgi:hypothetical protein
MIAMGMFSACDDSAEPDQSTDNEEDSNSDATPTATLVGDIERDGNYVLELTDGTDTLLFECTAEKGGLITQLALNGINILADESVGNANGYGSTFWVAPQTVWNWPPPAVLSTEASTPEVVSATSTITLTSGVDENLNIQVIKKFSPDLARFAIVLEYTIVNTGTEPVSFAPWEISRVLPGGITFFPTGDEVDEVTGMKLLTVTDVDGVSWFDHTAPLSSGDYKYIADGSGGILAHAFEDMIFVKSFEDQPASAKPPEQGEIQLYVKGGSYQEVEQMGAYEEIPVGGQTSWTIRWYLRNLPSDAAVEVGNQPLVDFVNSLVK